MLVEDKNTELIDAIRAAVEEKGRDYVYRTPDQLCVYFSSEKEPSCLIGDGLHRVGYTLSTLRKEYDDSAVPRKIKGEDCNRKVCNIVLHQLGYDRDIALACRTGQVIQDNNATWGEALDAIQDVLIDQKVVDKYWR